MTYAEIAAMVESIGYPFAYDHFAEGESPAPPFLVFSLNESNNFMADDRVYSEITSVRIELYTDLKLPKVERKIEKVLDANEIPWDKYEEWIKSEQLYEVEYSFETLYEPEDDEDDTNDSNTDDSDDDGG